MNGNQNKRNGLTSKLHVRIPIKLAERLENAARAYSTEDNSVTESDIVRIALDKFLPALDAVPE